MLLFRRNHGFEAIGLYYCMVTGRLQPNQSDVARFLLLYQILKIPKGVYSSVTTFAIRQKAKQCALDAAGIESVL